MKYLFSLGYFMRKTICFKVVCLSIILLAWSVTPALANYHPLNTHSLSKSAICAVDDSESVLNVLKNRGRDLTFTYQSDEMAATEKFYVYIPPAPSAKSISILQLTSGRNYGHVRLAVRFGKQPADYNWNFSEATPGRPFNNLQLFRDQDVIFNLGGTSTNLPLLSFNLPNQFAGDQLYINRYKTKSDAISRSSVSIQFSYKETIKWCEGEQEPTKPAKPSPTPEPSPEPSPKPEPSLPAPVEQRKADCIAAGGTWIDMFGITGFCNMLDTPLPSEEPEVPEKFKIFESKYQIQIDGHNFKLSFKKKIVDENNWEGELYYKGQDSPQYLSKVASEDGVIVKFLDLEFYGFFLGDRFIISEKVLEFVKEE